MATWKQVRDYLMSEFNADYNDDTDLLDVELSFKDGRSQIARITTGGNADKIWIHIYSRIGTVSKNDIYSLLREAQDSLTGGIVAIDDKIWYRSEIFLDDGVDLEYIKFSIKQAAIWADDFEDKYVGGDDN